MINKKIIILFTILLYIPLVHADNTQGGGGGGSSAIIVPTKYSYEECNVLLDNKIEIYKKATEKSNLGAKVFFFMIGIILLVSVTYLLISLGMNIQQIKDKGIKEWWKSKWKRRT